MDSRSFVVSYEIFPSRVLFDHLTFNQLCTDSKLIFLCRDLQRLQRLKANVVVNNDFLSRLTSGPISQILLISCFVAVLVAAARYLHILNRFHRLDNNFSSARAGQSPMTRNRSMMSYMMLDEKNGRNQLGIKTEWSGYVY